MCSFAFLLSVFLGWKLFCVMMRKRRRSRRREQCLIASFHSSVFLFFVLSFFSSSRVLLCPLFSFLNSSCFFWLSSCSLAFDASSMLFFLVFFPFDVMSYLLSRLLYFQSRSSFLRDFLSSFFILLSGYRRVRTHSPDPWPLVSPRLYVLVPDIEVRAEPPICASCRAFPSFSFHLPRPFFCFCACSFLLLITLLLAALLLPP